MIRMGGMKAEFMFWPAIAGILALLVAVQIHLNPWRGTEKKLEQLMYLPKGEYLKVASLGYRELAADLLWLQAIQVMGERNVSESQGQWLYHALDTITTVDPKFVRAYEAGGLALTTLVVLTEESNRLLMKGMSNNPTEWKFPFLLGINYYYELYDDASAAAFMSQASRLPGAPTSLGTLAANLFVSARSAQQAVDLLTALYKNTADESAKKLLEIRLRIAETERDLQLIEQAIDRYKVQYGRAPQQLEELVETRILSTLPVEPAGGRYLYDKLTGSVTSSEMPERLKLTGRRRNR